MLRGAGVPAAPRRRGRRAGQAAVRAARPAGARRRARDTARLRDEALGKVRERAGGLGFERRRSLRLARRGRQRHDRGARPPALRRAPGSAAAAGRAQARRQRRAPRRPRAMPEALRWFAVVAPGLEDVARDESSRRCPTSRRSRPRRAASPGRGRRRAGLRANLWSRVATRVLARVGEVEAREFGKLRHRAARLPWRAFIAPGGDGGARARARATAASTTRARWPRRRCSAVADAVPGAARREDATRPADVTLLVRGVDDRFMFSADASGELLHRRGARIEAGAAPLRETLAAGAAGARRLAAGDGAGRPDVRRGDDRDRGGDAGDGPRAGRRARVRDGALAARDRPRARAGDGRAARRSERRRRTIAQARARRPQSSAPTETRA